MQKHFEGERTLELKIVNADPGCSPSFEETITLQQKGVTQ